MSEPLKVRGMVLFRRLPPESMTDGPLSSQRSAGGSLLLHVEPKAKQPLLASTSPFAFGTFTVYEGRDAYTLVRPILTVLSWNPRGL